MSVMQSCCVLLSYTHMIATLSLFLSLAHVPEEVLAYISEEMQITPAVVSDKRLLT